MSRHNTDSVLYRFHSCRKYVFYRLINERLIEWRNLAYSFNKQLIRKIQNNSEMNNSISRCLIIDYTDLPKTCRKIELINKIFYHIMHIVNFSDK